jgi:hypothetical protein
MPPTIVLSDKSVVVDPILISSVVWRIDVDHANLAAVRRAQQAQRIEVIALDDEIWKRRGCGVIRVTVAKLRHNPRQHNVFVDRAVTVKAIVLPVQAELLLRKPLDE